MVHRCPRSGFLDVGGMLFRPGPDLAEQSRKVLAELRQFILDPRRYDRIDLAPDEPVALQHAQRLRQHFRRDAFQLAGELAIAQAAAPQRANRQIDPFAGQHFEHRMRRACAPECIVAKGTAVFTIH